MNGCANTRSRAERTSWNLRPHGRTCRIDLIRFDAIRFPPASKERTAYRSEPHPKIGRIFRQMDRTLHGFVHSSTESTGFQLHIKAESSHSCLFHSKFAFRVKLGEFESSVTRKLDCFFQPKLVSSILIPWSWNPPSPVLFSLPPGTFGAN